MFFLLKQWQYCNQQGHSDFHFCAILLYTALKLKKREQPVSGKVSRLFFSQKTVSSLLEYQCLTSSQVVPRVPVVTLQTPPQFYLYIYFNFFLEVTQKGAALLAVFSIPEGEISSGCFSSLPRIYQQLLLFINSNSHLASGLYLPAKYIQFSRGRWVLAIFYQISISFRQKKL